MVRANLSMGKDPKFLTVPVLHPKHNPQPPINDIHLVSMSSWGERHLRTLRSLYQALPFFEYYFPALEELYQQENNQLSPFLIQIIQWHFKILFPGKQLYVASREGVTDSVLLSGWLKKRGEFFWVIHPGEESYYRRVFPGIPCRRINPLPRVKFPREYHSGLPLLILLFQVGPEAALYFPDPE